MVLNDLKRHKEAEECYSKVIELNLTDSMAHYSKGIVFDNLERYLEAIELNSNNTLTEISVSKEFHQEDAEYDEFTCKSTKIDWDPHYKVN